MSRSQSQNKAAYDNIKAEEITHILPHYNVVKNDIIDGMRLIEDIALEDSYGHTFYAITDGSYLLQTEEGAEIRGEAFMIRDGRIEQICGDGEVFIL